MCLFPTSLTARSGGNTDDAVVGILAFGHVGGELEVLPFELACACLNEVEVAVEVYIDVPAEEFGGYVEEVAVLL
jgi:hypothetical protein